MQLPDALDRTEIYEMYARYGWALDTGDTDGYVAQFVFEPDPQGRPHHWVLGGRSAVPL
jgi:hypothetical protein